MNEANENRRLVLMRHAKAEPLGAGSDMMRPLALTGRRQASAAGNLMAEHGLVPDAVFVSGALRTRQTWELVCNGLDIEPSFAQVSDDLYLAHPSDGLALVNSFGNETTVLVVGHEPTMSALATFLSGPESESSAYNIVRFGLQTSGFAVVESKLPWAQWGPQTGSLSAALRPNV